MRGATRSSRCLVPRMGDFNPRSSCEERRSAARCSACFTTHFNPRSSCEERPGAVFCYAFYGAISIHAPHARSDDNSLTTAESGLQFQSTLLMRGATRGTSRWSVSATNFNPRSSCEERHVETAKSRYAKLISIHAPHARSDGYGLVALFFVYDFNPRSSCEERRLSPQCKRLKRKLFQSTLLMRGATMTIKHLFNHGLFQSTLLMRGATWTFCGRAD